MAWTVFRLTLCRNINVFGLALIVSLAVVAILLDTVVMKQVITITKVKRIRSLKIDHWIQDGVFQLQRRAYEACGEGVWDNLDREVPVTIGKHMLAKPAPSLSSSSSFSDGMA